MRFVSLLIFFSTATLSFAALGEKPKGAGKLQMLKASGSGRTPAPLAVQHWVTETQQHSTYLRQFSINSIQPVYAIAWNGKRHPELRSLLGPYLQEFDDAIASSLAKKKSTPRGRSRVIETPHLHIIQQGHARGMWGRIIIPHLMPLGTNADEIR